MDLTVNFLFYLSLCIGQCSVSCARMPGDLRLVCAIKRIPSPPLSLSCTVLLLGAGHCFRDHVLGVCPELMHFSQTADGIQKMFEGLSLETIRHMVASGAGMTVLPWTSVPELETNLNKRVPTSTGILSYVPFTEPVPDRRVVLVWRKSFTRLPAIDVIRSAIFDCNLSGLKRLDLPAQSNQAMDCISPQATAVAQEG